ncbi:MAG: TatD family hydrolase [bacterium]
MFVDTHCHLNEYEDLESVLEKARSQGISGFISVGYDVISSKVSLELSRKYKDVYAILGIHPHNAEEYNRDFLNWTSKNVNDKKVLGIGEIGLDYYRNLSPKELQIEAFKGQLEFARNISLPISLHIREAYDEAIEILKDYNVKGVFHCFSGDLTHLERALSMGFFIGFDGPVTFQNANKLIEIVKECPLDRVLIETDAPYLAPAPFRGKRNEPSYLVYIAERIAKIKNISIEELVRALLDNTKRCFPKYDT